AAGPRAGTMVASRSLSSPVSSAATSGPTAAASASSACVHGPYPGAPAQQGPPPPAPPPGPPPATTATRAVLPMPASPLTIASRVRPASASPRTVSSRRRGRSRATKSAPCWSLAGIAPLCDARIWGCARGGSGGRRSVLAPLGWTTPPATPGGLHDHVRSEAVQGHHPAAVGGGGRRMGQLGADPRVLARRGHRADAGRRAG